MTVEDLWALKRIGPATLSPDGRFACVAVTRYDMAKNEGSSQLWLLSTDGKTQRQLTRGRRDSDPQWSPDGQWIGFVSKRGEGKEGDEAGQLYRIAADGGEAERLTSLATGVSGLRWFPDSSRIAFLSWVWPDLKTEKEQAARVKQDKDDKLKAIIVESNHYRYWDHWFPRGRKPHLHILDLRTGKCRDLFAGTGLHLPPQDPDANDFDISPDSREIAFSFDAEPDPAEFAFTDIVVLEVASGRSVNLTEAFGRPHKHACATPRYSPDGEWIAFRAMDYGRAHNEQARAWLIRRRSGDVTPLTTQWDRGVNAPLILLPVADSAYTVPRAPTATSRAARPGTSAIDICQLKPMGANTTASQAPKCPAILYWIAGPVAPGGGAGKELKAHRITINARMMVPTRVRKISTRCHRPMPRLRRFGQW